MLSPCWVAAGTTPVGMSSSVENGPGTMAGLSGGGSHAVGFTTLPRGMGSSRRVAGSSGSRRRMLPRRAHLAWRACSGLSPSCACGRLEPRCSAAAGAGGGGGVGSAAAPDGAEGGWRSGAAAAKDGITMPRRAASASSSGEAPPDVLSFRWRRAATVSLRLDRTICCPGCATRAGGWGATVAGGAEGGAEGVSLLRRPPPAACSLTGRARGGSGPASTSDDGVRG